MFTEIKQRLEKLGLSDKQINSHLKRLDCLKDCGIESEIRNGWSFNGWPNVEIKLKTEKRDVKFCLFKTCISVYTTERFGNRLIGKGLKVYGSKDEVLYALEWINGKH